MLISLTESTKNLTFGDLLIPIGQFQYAEADSDYDPRAYQILALTALHVHNLKKKGLP